MKPQLSEITIRNEIRPGDLGYVVHLHGLLYAREYGYGIHFESYVASSIHEFAEGFDAAKDRVWFCEHNAKIIGFVFMMHRPENTAQLRYFLIAPEYRGIGLGKHLMELFMKTLGERGYSSVFLLTTSELGAAASLYTRHGFRLVTEEESSAFGKPVREQRYELSLLHRPDHGTR